MSHLPIYSNKWPFSSLSTHFSFPFFYFHSFCAKILHIRGEERERKIEQTHTHVLVSKKRKLNLILNITQIVNFRNVNFHEMRWSAQLRFSLLLTAGQSYSHNFSSTSFRSFNNSIMLIT